MAFDKYKNNAWQEPETGLKRYQSGAWNLCDFAKRYKNSAWEEVWTNVKLMTYFYRTTKTGYFNSAESKYEMTWIAAVDDPGCIIFAAEGNFVDPVIAFDYMGSLTSFTSNGQKFWNTGVAYTYARTTNGSETTGDYVDLGSTTGSTEGVCSYPFKGNFNRVGVKVQLYNRNISPDAYNGFVNAAMIFIKNITINGDPYIPDGKNDYDYNDWA